MLKCNYFSSELSGLYRKTLPSYNKFDCAHLKFVISVNPESLSSFFSFQAMHSGKSFMTIYFTIHWSNILGVNLSIFRILFSLCVLYSCPWVFICLCVWIRMKVFAFMSKWVYSWSSRRKLSGPIWQFLKVCPHGQWNARRIACIMVTAWCIPNGLIFNI